MQGDLYQHLLELIFKNTHDPIILEKLKRVNIYWKKSIDQILETTEVWKSACLNEIPSEPITRMITRLFPTIHFENYHQLEDPILWRSLYISYRKSMILSKLRVSIQVKIDFSKFLNSHDTILKFARYDKYFAVGSSDARILIFDINGLNKLLYTVYLDNPINDIRFWFSDTGNLFLVAIILPSFVKFWNLPTMIEVPCNGNTEGSSICSGTINRLLIMSIDRGLFEYKHTDEGITAIQIMDRLEPRALGIKLFSDHHKTIIAADYRSSHELFNYRLPTSEEGNGLIEENRKLFDNEEPYISFYYIQPIYFFLTSNIILRIINIARLSSLLFYDPKSNWSMFNPFKIFGSENSVTSGILHGKLLILGFESGQVRIFTVENIELLKKSNLNLESGIEHRVAGKSIEWLELFETREKLVIIAMADRKVYSINFFPNRTREQKIICNVQ